MLPGLEDTSPSGLLKWSESLLAAIRRLWTTLIYTVNALSLVDTLANRTATPGQNHLIFTASDSLQTFVGVAGVWQNAGPRRGTVTVAEAATTATVTLSPAEPNTSYAPILTPQANVGNFWTSSLLAGSFVVNIETAPGVGGAVIGWTLWRTASG